MGRKTDPDRDKVLVRDGFRCQVPLCKTFITDLKQLHVHHIDGNVENQDMKNKVTMCSSCHCIETRGRIKARRRFREIFEKQKAYKKEQALLFAS